MRIIISGLTASGKSTLAMSLARDLSLRYFSASSKLREFMPVKDFKYWESKKGLDAVRFRLQKPQYDKRLDNYILNYARKNDNFIIDSWVASWKLKGTGIIRIYLRSDVKERARRVSERDHILYKDALVFMKEKDKLTALIYKKLYGIDVINDFTPFDLMVNCSSLGIDALHDLCKTFILKTNPAK